MIQTGCTEGRETSVHRNIRTNKQAMYLIRPSRGARTHVSRTHPAGSAVSDLDIAHANKRWELGTVAVGDLRGPGERPSI